MKWAPWGSAADFAPMKSLGVGLVYWPALESLFTSADVGLEVLELEPQTLWEQVADRSGWRYRVNDALLERVAALPQPKLLHGVGQPFAGTVADPIDSGTLLSDAAMRLQPAWVSEHLSFNRAPSPDGLAPHAGFLFPPVQTLASVRAAAHRIAGYRATVGRPVAFETGVNYLRQRTGELDDGTFFAQVAEQADCGIVLDLHNLWCNERNGRCTVASVIDRLPLDRVWELHVAGGMEAYGYWIDAHSGAVPDAVMQIAAELVSRLPNLGALIFEVLPEHLPSIGLDGVHRQIEVLQTIWKSRSEKTRDAVHSGRIHVPPEAPSAADLGEMAEWESSLLSASRGVQVPDGPFAYLASDPGCHLLGLLVDEARCANLARALRYTLTALLAGVGAVETRKLLDTYCMEVAAQPFAAVEADAFACFLRERRPECARIDHFQEVLDFEHALIRASIYGTSSDLTWSADPLAIFAALDLGVLPSPLNAAHIEMRIETG